MSPNWFKSLILPELMVVLICLPACTKKPSNAQIDAWHKEAVARNAQLIAVNAKKSQQPEWDLVVQGQTTAGKSVKLNWRQLQALATKHVKTPDANYVLKPDTIFDFRGIPVSTLLKQFGTASNVTNITFVCFDSYQVTVALKDLLTYPIILAIERDGKPIPRNQGGPIYLVFPYTQHPELKPKYSESLWAFYVSHMVVGTEPVRLRVGQRQLDSVALNKLPQITISEPVGYRKGWSNGNVKLQGVRVRDVLAMSGVQLPPDGEVTVWGKPPIYQDTANPIRLAADDVRKCDVLLATRWGDDNKPIPAKMGGPVTLAFGTDCQAKTSRASWVTFVEGLSIAP